MKYDFSGWVTKNDVLCTDGTIVKHNAFAGDDGKRVALVWGHNHDMPSACLGHALLKNTEAGVYAYAYFNNTDEAQHAREAVMHGDLNSLSIYANKVKRVGRDIVHGCIREVSLVYAGADETARIDNIVMHGDDDYSSAILYMGEEIEIEHSDKDDEKDKKEEEMKKEEEDVKKPAEEDASEKPESKEHKESDDDKDDGSLDGKTVQDVLDSLPAATQRVVYGLIQTIIDEKEEEKNVKHNAFEGTNYDDVTVISHSDQAEIIGAAKKSGRFQEALNDYMEDNETISHGIDDIESLFPEYKDIKPGAPELLTDDQSWISTVINGVAKSPIARIRTRQADVRNIESIRGLGYKKGAKKTNMGNIKLISRTTDPQTVYVRDALNRDDILDITDFDVVNYLYQGVMLPTLKEEIATAILLGDGRDDGDANKISPDHIRPVWTDDDLYTIHADVDIAAARKELQGTNTSANFSENYIYAEAIIAAALYSREKYKGSGNLTFFCTPHLLNVMLLARDLNGRRIYDSKSDLAAALNVASIQTVEQFEGKTRTVVGATSNTKKNLLGIFINLADYQVGSAKGGEITTFKQFDIDFNQEKCLIETRLSGALKRVYSAIVLEEPVDSTAESDT